MGCASSAPLIESGKKLVEGVKESTNDTINKGENVINDTADTVKEGLGTMKESVQNAINTAEETMGSMAHKIGDTFHLTSTKAADALEDTKDNLNSAKDDVLTSASEAVSEAETILISEKEQAKEAFQSGTSPFFETVHSLDAHLDDAINDMQHKKMEVLDAAKLEVEHAEDEMDSMVIQGTEVLEDLENHSVEMLGENVEKLQVKVEELKSREEDGAAPKEEPPPTFWEAAADAILLKKTIKGFEQTGHEQDHPDKLDRNEFNNEKWPHENDLIIENTDNVEH